MADDDFDLYGEDDGFGNPTPQVQVGLPAFLSSQTSCFVDPSRSLRRLS